MAENLDEILGEAGKDFRGDVDRPRHWKEAPVEFVKEKLTGYCDPAGLMFVVQAFHTGEIVRTPFAYNRGE